MRIIDADQHLFESRNLWAEHAPTADKGKLLSIVDDDRGYSWLAVGGQRTDHFVWWGEPGDWVKGTIARQTERQRQGEPADRSYDDMPADHTDFRARVKRMDEWGIDAAQEYPNWTLSAARVCPDMDAAHANFAAWNRYAAEVQVETGGRLMPAGVVTFEDDFSWAREQLSFLSEHGVRSALMTPDLINGKRLSHPDNEPVWRMFLEYGIAPFWHISTTSSVVSPEWVDNEPHWYKVLEASFSRVQPQLCIADLAVNGTFHKFPELRLALIEYRPDWLPQLLFRIDNSWMMRRTHNGEVLTPEMDLKPSEYVTRQVRFGVFPEENPVELSKRIGPNNVLMWGGDYPHPEGYADSLTTYERTARARGTAIEESLYGGEIAWVLRLNDEQVETAA